MGDLRGQRELTEACTLPTAERPLRLAEFDSLFADHLRSIDDCDGQARFGLTDEPGLRERVADLARRETACCSFFTFTLEGTDEDLRLTVSAPPERRDVLVFLVARAQALASSGQEER